MKQFKIFNLILAPIISVVLLSCNGSDISKPSPLVTPRPSTTPAPSLSFNKAVWLAEDFPLNIKVSKMFSKDEFQEIQRMAKEWEIAVLDEYDFYDDDFDRTRKVPSMTLSDYTDDELGVYLSTDWLNGLSSNILAITRFSGRIVDKTLELFHADIIVNYRDHQFSVNQESDKYDLNSVILHEFGHFLGLFHNFNSQSVMYPSITAGAIKRTPSPADWESIQENYAFLDEYNSSGIYQSLLAPQNEDHKRLTRTKDKDLKKGDLVTGYFELNSAGICHHYLSGQIISSHFTVLKKQ